jgi:hypothetical protein
MLSGRMEIMCGVIRKKGIEEDEKRGHGGNTQSDREHVEDG